MQKDSALVTEPIFTQASSKKNSKRDKSANFSKDKSINIRDSTGSKDAWVVKGFENTPRDYSCNISASEISYSETRKLPHRYQSN